MKNNSKEYKYCKCCRDLIELDEFTSRTINNKAGLPILYYDNYCKKCRSKYVMSRPNRQTKECQERQKAYCKERRKKLKEK